MRALRLERPASIEHAPLLARELPDPRPGPGELLLSVRACGVCRTDLQLVEGELPARRLPIVPGHQIVGVVAALGEGVTDVALGTRVGVGWLAGSCGVCTNCSSGRENLCEEATFTGWDRDGGYATEVTVRATHVFALPPSFTDLEAAPLLCGGIIGYRSLVRSGVRPGQRLGLFGFGASALVTLQLARHWRCRVFVVTRSEEERRRALALGAEWAGTYDDRVPEALDAAITFAPSGDVVVAALRSLARGGTVAVNAIHLDRVPELSYDWLWWERGLVSVANYTRDDARAFLELAAKIPVRTQFDVFPLEEANTALARLRAGRIGGAAVLAVGRS